MSAFVWLDTQSASGGRCSMWSILSENTTRVTNLGVGSVRDAFADMLFPGTSTIMTRARYFLLLPWAYQRLEKLRVRSAEIPALTKGAPPKKH